MPVRQFHQGKVWKLSIYLDKKYVHIPPLRDGVRAVVSVDEVFSEPMSEAGTLVNRGAAGRVLLSWKGERQWSHSCSAMMTALVERVFRVALVLPGGSDWPRAMSLRSCEVRSAVVRTKRSFSSVALQFV